jgi:site-specific DNA-cytosine methylase
LQAAVVQEGSQSDVESSTTLLSSKDEEDVVDPASALKASVRAWHGKFSAHQLMSLQTGLKKFTLQPLRIGTGFSGCDIAWEVLKFLKDYWWNTFQLDIKMELSFCCESNLDKLEWLKSTHSECARVFRDMAELGKTRAVNMLTNKMELVPPVDLFLAGFVCVDRSKLNRNRANNINCVQDNSGKTGTSFHICASYIETNLPPAILLENVPDLQNKKPGHDDSDMDFILDWLRSRKYAASASVYDARDHGSIQARERLWFRAFLGDVDNEQKLNHCHAVCSACRIPPFSPTVFWGDNFGELSSATDWWVEDKGGSRTADPAFRDEHIAVFREAKLEYPPDFSKFDPALVKGIKPLEQRGREAVAYAESVEPWPEQMIVQFFDANMSIQYLVGASGDRDIWSDRCPTFASSSKIMARVELTDGERIWVLLPGFLLMRLVGWPTDLPDCENNKLMTSFAGNAFSAFSIGPILIGTLSVLSRV